MDKRHDEVSTADLAGQRPMDVEPDDAAADRMDRMDRLDRMGRMDEGDFDSHGRAVADNRTAADRVADERVDALADDRAAEIAPDADPGLDRPRRAMDGNGQAAVPPTTTETGPATSGAGAGAQALLASSDAEGFRARWTDVQAGFVDAPRQAVESADGLVAELMQHLAKTFADQRSGLERQWDRGDDVSTDDLRTVFQHYRSFFERLLST